MEILFSSLLGFLLIVFLPGIVICIIGWKVSNKITNVAVKSHVRAVLLALTLTPSMYGHAGVYPAIMVFFFGLSDGQWTAGVIPILFVWFVSTVILQLKTKNKSISKS
jgi:hypothetical protein